MAGSSGPKDEGNCDDAVDPAAQEGNPVTVATGNKFHRELDYSSSGSFPLVFERFYNSQSIDTTGFGTGWSASFFQRLNTVNPDAQVFAYRPDGRVVWFNKTGSQLQAGYSTQDSLVERRDASGGLTGWQLRTGGDVIEQYNVLGRLVSVTARSGFKQLMTYDGNGRLSQVADDLGRNLQFTYNSRGRLVTVQRPDGHLLTFGYDGDDKLIGVQYPDQTQKGYLYENARSPSALTGIVDENGARYASYNYDDQGRVTRSFHSANGQDVYAFAFIYNPDGSTSVSDPLGTTRGHQFQYVSGVARTVAIQGLPSRRCAYASSVYSGAGYPTQRINWNGIVTDYQRSDAFGRPDLETQRVEASATPAQRTTSTQWHATFRLPVNVAEPLRITNYVYNGDSGASCGYQADGTTLVGGVVCSKTIQPTSDATGAAGFGATPSGAPRTWNYAYNVNGSILTMDGPRTDASDVTTYTYYANDDTDPGKRGNIATIANAFGHTTSITAYNANGQPITIVDPNGLTTTLTYDARLRLTSRSVGGELTSYLYDGVGQLTQVTLPDGSSLTYTYDTAHRLTAIADSLGNKIAYTLDAMGNRTREQVLDPANVLAQTRSRVYDALNHLAQEIGAQNQTTQYTYDNQGNVTSVTDPLNRATSNQYDALNRLIKVTDPNLGQTQYAYNGIDQLVSVTDPRNLTTNYNYDGLVNLNQQQSPDTGTTVNTYDTAGNLLTQTDAKGQITTYAYNALNRRTGITFQDGSKQNYVYDQGANGIGRLTSITELDPAQQLTSQLAYAYDQKGRVTTETRTVNGVAYVLAYSYDAAGRLSGLTYPSGRTIAYTFDALGRINQVSTTPQGEGAQIVASSIAYQPFGGVKSYVLGNGQGYTRSYDLDGRIASYSLGSQFFALNYDEANRIRMISETGNAANMNTYEYDNLDRLIGAVLPNLPFAYGYDAVGNRTSKTVGSATDTYAYSATSNRLSSITAPAGATRNFSFDADGSTINDAINQYVYDSQGRMVQSTGALGTTTYQVNALGQRIRKSNSNDDRVFLYDSRGRLIAETDPGGGLKREYLYLNDIPLAVFQ
jgi:YD repeat-containing protein